jgi:aryl-alcohol dehydrogenase-like predicted oxidoreductase
MAPPVSNQPPYNLLRRDIEAEVLEAAAAAGVGQIVFSPLAQGVLCGKYRPGRPAPAGTRAADARVNQFIGAYLTPENLQRTAALVRIAKRLGSSPAQVALAWCLRDPRVHSAIVGATTTAQLEENLAAADLQLDVDVLAELDAAFPGPTARDTAT